MNNYFPTRFEGGLEEVKQYHMVLVNTLPIYTTIQRNLQVIHSDLFIFPYETEELTGWCIKEVIHRAFPNVRMLDHTLNDRYQMVCDQLLLGMEHMFNTQLTPSLNSCTVVRCLRVLPMMDKSLLAIGT